MKLVIVGGSAHSTPALIDTADIRSVLDRLEIVLVGRNPERLGAVARAMRVLARPRKLRVRAADTKKGINAAFRGADLILVQARYGGYTARHHDERFPLAQDVPGDEGLGPGGLASAWRSWPHINALLKLVERQAPAADVVLLTAPLGILTRSALHRFPRLRVAGLCELPRVTLRLICDRAHVAEKRVRYAYAGVNHLGWFDAADTPETDLIKRFAQTCDAVSFPDRALVERLHAVPLSYLKLHYRRADAVAEQRAATQSRARELERLAVDAFAAFTSGDATAIRSVLARRQTPWYSYAVGPYIAGRCGALTDGPFFFTTTNNHYLDGFSANEVLEIPFAMKSGKTVPIDRAIPLSEPLLVDLKTLVDYERLAAKAVLERSREGLIEAVASHPWVTDPARADALATAIYASPDGAPAPLPT